MRCSRRVSSSRAGAGGEADSPRERRRAAMKADRSPSATPAAGAAGRPGGVIAAGVMDCAGGGATRTFSAGGSAGRASGARAACLRRPVVSWAGDAGRGTRAERARSAVDAGSGGGARRRCNALCPPTLALSRDGVSKAWRHCQNSAACSNRESANASRTVRPGRGAPRACLGAGSQTGVLNRARRFRKFRQAPPDR